MPLCKGYSSASRAQRVRPPTNRADRRHWKKEFQRRGSTGLKGRLGWRPVGGAHDDEVKRRATAGDDGRALNPEGH